MSIEKPPKNPFTQPSVFPNITNNSMGDILNNNKILGLAIGNNQQSQEDKEKSKAFSKSLQESITRQASIPTLLEIQIDKHDEEIECHKEQISLMKKQIEDAEKSSKNAKIISYISVGVSIIVAIFTIWSYFNPVIPK
ncbi:guided entry of tail-anchored proteins factor 1 [Peptostreptococcus faecalis]|uniref:hypothetical protein n=1 Tax=Peptostreptococcus faecalis TaxID=2045015 RepID=UPI000C7C24B2|nr:hypothetical protein [Peptostreptococcus faecalis]